MMASYFVNNLIVTFCILQSTVFAIQSLPRNWERCFVNDNECLRSAIDGAVHDLKNGSPELGIRSLEPLVVSALDMPGGTIVRVKQHLRNVQIYGLGDSTVKSASVNLGRKQLRAKSFSPELRLQANYKFDGRVMIMDVKGDGECNVTLFNTEIDHFLKGESIEVDGREFIKIDKYYVKLYPQKVAFKFDNMENGPLVNGFLNKQWKLFFDDIKHGYQKAFGVMFKDLANNVFQKIPVDDIFILQ